jgi:hypothetical protein
LIHVGAQDVAAILGAFISPCYRLYEWRTAAQVDGDQIAAKLDGMAERRGLTADLSGHSFVQRILSQ